MYCCDVGKAQQPLLDTAGETQNSITGASAGATPASGQESQAQRPKVPLIRMDKAPELVAFEAGREVMDVLRAAHSHMCNVLEVISSDLGAAFCSHANFNPVCGQMQLMLLGCRS